MHNLSLLREHITWFDEQAVGDFNRSNSLVVISAKKYFSRLAKEGSNRQHQHPLARLSELAAKIVVILVIFAKVPWCKLAMIKAKSVVVSSHR
ncbi:hypothetical protein ACFP2D_01550 [Corynebacterium gerontici]